MLLEKLFVFFQPVLEVLVIFALTGLMPASQNFKNIVLNETV